MPGNLAGACYVVCRIFFSKFTFLKTFRVMIRMSFLQFGSRSGPTECLAWSVSTLFATHFLQAGKDQMVFWKFTLEVVLRMVLLRSLEHPGSKFVGLILPRVPKIWVWSDSSSFFPIIVPQCCQNRWRMQILSALERYPACTSFSSHYSSHADKTRSAPFTLAMPNLETL